MHNSQWITFHSQSCHLLYFCCANLLHMLHNIIIIIKSRWQHGFPWRSLSLYIPIIYRPSTSSKLYSVSAQSWFKKVIAGRLTLERFCVGAQRQTSRSQLGLAFLGRLTLIFCVKLSNSCFFVGCCFYDLFQIVRSILV